MTIPCSDPGRVRDDPYGMIVISHRPFERFLTDVAGAPSSFDGPNRDATAPLGAYSSPAPTPAVEGAFGRRSTRSRTFYREGRGKRAADVCGGGGPGVGSDRDGAVAGRSERIGATLP